MSLPASTRWLCGGQPRGARCAGNCAVGVGGLKGCPARLQPLSIQIAVIFWCNGPCQYVNMPLYQSQDLGLGCVCCHQSQSSYYGSIIIAIVIPHNWTRLCCLQGTSLPVTSSDSHGRPVRQARVTIPIFQLSKHKPRWPEVTSPTSDSPSAGAWDV